MAAMSVTFNPPYHTFNHFHPYINPLSPSLPSHLSKKPTMADSNPDSSFQNPQVLAISGKFMLASIVVLFLLLLFIIFFHLYSKWLWVTPESPPRTRRTFVFATPNHPTMVHGRGLDQSTIQSLPVLVFQSKNFEDGLDCAVCLCGFEENEKARLLPKCNHSFHIDCIDMWFQSHSTCPLCRTSVEVDDPNHSYPNENSDSYSDLNLGVENSFDDLPAMVIDIPTRVESLEIGMSSNGLESFRRVVSGEKRVVHSGGDIEQGGDGL